MKKDGLDTRKNWWIGIIEPEVLNRKKAGLDIICSFDRVTCKRLVGSSSLL